MTGLLPALAGANLIYGLGMFESGMTMSYGQLVMDNEFVSMIKRVLKGIPINADTLAVDVLQEVGPFKDFLSHEHTLKHMRNAQTYPELIDRRIREDWEFDGSLGIYERSWTKARQILETHKPEPLPDDVLATLRAIVNNTEQELNPK